MCKICARIQSLIDTMESLHSLDDWKALILESPLVDEDEDVSTLVLTDDRNVWMNIISIVAAHWFIRKGIPPLSASASVLQHITFLHLTAEIHIDPLDHPNQERSDGKDNS